jgi:pimeloyl-ACP methyl ester carboxylesterase
MVAAMISTGERPTILIVPGSFSPPPLYASIVDHLNLHGYEAIVVNYPSIGRRDPLPPATMADDAAYTSAVVEKLADAGKSIVMVTHSYGGIVGTESTKDLAKTEREAVGKAGGIVRLLYITSLVPRVGESLQTLMGTEVASFLRIEVSTAENATALELGY